MSYRMFEPHGILQAFSRWITCACLSLTIVVAVSSAQQVKEYSWKDEPQYVGDAPPFKQPDVYWHDPDLRLDLDSSKEPWSVIVQRNGGEIARLPLGDELGIARVNAIHRAAPDRAVLLAQMSAGAHVVGVIGTNPLKLLDHFWTSGEPGLSPDNHYVIFDRFYPAHGADNYDDQYRLYDVLGTRTSNWPKRPAHDGPPWEPMNYDDTLAGVPVYSLKANEVDRENTNVPEGTEHEGGIDFLWSADSSKVVFADSQAGVITLVLVMMPVDGKGGPQTLVHPLIGSENICLAGGVCDSTDVQSLNWNGDAVDVKLHFQPQHEKSREMTLVIPFASFAPAPK